MNDILVDYDSLMAPVVSYHVMDGRTKTYDVKEAIGNWGGYWVSEANCFQVDNPEEMAIAIFENMGLIVKKVEQKE